MHQGALIYFLWLLFIVFLAVLLLITVNIIRLNRARRREEHRPKETLGTGGRPFPNEQSPRTQQIVDADDVDVGGNVITKPTDNHHQAAPLENTNNKTEPIRRNVGSTPGGNSTGNKR